MNSQTETEFWECYAQLPLEIQRQAREAYRNWLAEPSRPGLRFKLLFRGKREYWSVRITRGYRAVGYREGDLITWFWIGPHSNYDQLLRHLR